MHRHSWGSKCHAMPTFGQLSRILRRREILLPMRLVVEGLVLTIFCLVLQIAPARADSIATINVSASFTTGGLSNPPILNYQPPTLFVTGQIFYDMTTNSLIGVNMSLLGPAGSTAQFSSQGYGGCSIWINDMYEECGFSGGSGSAFVEFGIINFSPTMAVGDTWGACAARYTLYPNGDMQMGQGPCPMTSSAGFDNVAGFIYTLPDNSSSGQLTVVSISTPEPSTLLLLATGLLALIGLAAKWKPGTCTLRDGRRDRMA